MTPEQRAICAEAYAITKSYRAAAKAAGVSKSTAQRVLTCPIVPPVATGATADRDATGQFALGRVPTGGGSTTGARARRALMLASVSDSEAVDLFRALVTAGLDGDVAAATKALLYLAGPPDAGEGDSTSGADDGLRFYSDALKQRASVA